MTVRAAAFIMQTPKATMVYAALDGEGTNIKLPKFPGKIPVSI